MPAYGGSQSNALMVLLTLTGESSTLVAGSSFLTAAFLLMGEVSTLFLAAFMGPFLTTGAAFFLGAGTGSLIYCVPPSSTDAKAESKSIWLLSTGYAFKLTARVVGALMAAMKATNAKVLILDVGLFEVVLKFNYNSPGQSSLYTEVD